MLDGAIEVDGVPVHNCGGDETEARGAEALVLERAISNLALTDFIDRRAGRPRPNIRVTGRKVAVTRSEPSDVV
jgi:hypothetical protein